jgi:effector-binding domain-containing protein
MLSTLSSPEIAKTHARHIAFIHVTVPRLSAPGEAPNKHMKEAIQAGLGELAATLEAQGVAATGPWFAHHLRKPDDNFDFEITLPVSQAVTPTGRVEAGISPILEVIQTTYTGPYEDLPEAWQDFMGWVKDNGHNVADHFYEVYTKNPGDGVESSHYQTELICPLAKSCYVG